MPLGESMLLTLKNNKDLIRLKKKLLNPFIGKRSVKDVSLFNFPKATPELLEKIRLQKQIDQKEETIQSLISVIVVLILIIILLF
ncbi:hypothetical protein [Lacinutrix salivirga]